MGVFLQSKKEREMKCIMEAVKKAGDVALEVHAHTAALIFQEECETNLEVVHELQYIEHTHTLQDIHGLRMCALRQLRECAKEQQIRYIALRNRDTKHRIKEYNQERKIKENIESIRKIQKE